MRHDIILKPYIRWHWTVHHRLVTLQCHLNIYIHIPTYPNPNCPHDLRHEALHPPIILQHMTLNCTSQFITLHCHVQHSHTYIRTLTLIASMTLGVRGHDTMSSQNLGAWCTELHITHIHHTSLPCSTKYTYISHHKLVSHMKAAKVLNLLNDLLIAQEWRPLLKRKKSIYNDITA